MEVELDDSCADEELEDPSCGDDGGESEFHEGAFVGGEDDAHPVEGVAAFRAEDSVDGDLAADQVNEQGYGGVEDLLAVVDVAAGTVDEGEQLDGWLKHVEDPETHRTNYYYYNTASHATVQCSIA